MVIGILENNMNNARTTSSRSRANRRAQGSRCRERVRPRRLVLSKVVDVVSNSNCALGTTVGSKSNGKYSAAVLSAFGESLEVPFSRKVNKQGEDPYLAFEVMLRCVVTLYHKGDDNKTAPMPYTLTLKKQLVQFSCEE